MVANTDKPQLREVEMKLLRAKQERAAASETANGATGASGEAEPQDNDGRLSATPPPSEAAPSRKDEESSSALNLVVLGLVAVTQIWLLYALSFDPMAPPKSSGSDSFQDFDIRRDL
uniref:Uncharacterized protein n=1 Tax=Octactis speculum TaxID=3111310 RepID=A0A7S2F8A8_9STRA|mmetsp:Transcript_17212/g.23165  ORF Transcript_17212/g.23165 Transcript_17212/m.23165 type:complete len:117 (+) Transcript_17212:169-519(+)|eukprot:CAMPEP_0185751700 /NCGR_PEP_ID=MMETSP1174-20130828/10475_1 /TAXON_ID=35687 /ORGANISM="Dictyocha speculum, Strain CCMP1381" /LENGTH=116 /DNA_ID=CAMNT_0028428789 /DNA_START=169 /DNA_END=519 /DNA_ORIENTATION=+